MNDIIRLYYSPQRFLFEPLQKNNSPSLEIDRNTGRIATTQSKFNPSDKVQDIYGIIGVIRLLAGNYLLVITGRHCVGHINGAEIWKVTRTRIFPYQDNATSLSPSQKLDEAKYVQMVEWMLAVEGFYYSYSYDLTLSLQRIYSIDESLKTKPLWARADPRFFWNYNLLKDFINMKLDAWILPLMFGFVGIGSDQINGKPFNFALISRRSNKRIGTRYYVRGIDAEGNVANAVETEQLVLLPGSSSLRGATGTSLVQTRGSIPLFWRQTPNLKYKPRLLLYGQPIETTAACRRHFEELSKRHNKVVVINLIDQKGSELALGENYENNVRLLNNPNTKYVAFDFHHQCRKMRYDKLSILIDQVDDDLSKQGFFFVENDKVQIKQDGVFRTNCVDNLDRTNVVQSLLGRRSLEQQLMKLGILTNASQSIRNYPFDSFYKNVWADNADALSLQYSGTGALKNDFTRTGKRTLQGTLNDGLNSVTRYVLNNFYDGFRQDAFDLFVGNYVVDSSSPSPFRVQQKIINYVIAAFFVLLLMVYLFTPSEATFFHRFVMVVVGLVLMLAAWRILLRYGKYIVDRPALYLKEF